VQGLILPFEGLLHVSNLRDDRYQLDRRSHSLSGYRGGNSFRLGDRVRVVLESVDLEKRSLSLGLAPPDGSRGGEGTAGLPPKRVKQRPGSQRQGKKNTGRTKRKRR
jgi:ribonuclease R